MPKELLVNQIILGFIKIKIGADKFIIKNPSIEHRMDAEKLYIKTANDAVLRGALTDDDTDTILRANGIWNDEKESLLKKTYEDIDELKVRIYENDSEKGRRLLAAAKEMQSKLYAERNSLSFMTANGIASLAKSKYLVMRNTYKNKKRFFDNKFWQNDSYFLDKLTQRYYQQKPTDVIIRALARDEQWRSFWQIRRITGNIFGKSAINLTDEQRQLISWSLLYDNVMENYQEINEDILADDDMLDGFLILKKRERDLNSNKQAGENLLKNEKIRNSAEVFVVVDSPKKAQIVKSMNSPEAQAVKEQRLAYIEKVGQVNEANMPDTKLKIQMALNNRGVKPV